MTAQEELLDLLDRAKNDNSFIRCDFAKPFTDDEDLTKVRFKIYEGAIGDYPYTSIFYGRQFDKQEEELKDGELLSRIKTMVENQNYRSVTLYTTAGDYTLQVNRNGSAKLHRRRASQPFAEQKPSVNYLTELDILHPDGRPQKGKGDKFRQINKFVEVMDGLLDTPQLQDKNRPLRITDMGAGKGYLTFALYDYLQNKKDRAAEMTGVEVRPDLVSKCNLIARMSGFENLKFAEGYIKNYPLPQTDVLIALHACDIATDEAIYKGIRAGAKLIVCAPCCHKQIRKQIDCTSSLQSMLQHGIFKERTAEMLTDTIRALLLEANGYTVKIFEFISLEHTGKNILLTAEKQDGTAPETPFLENVKKLKAEFGVKKHYLETLLEE